MFLVAVVRLTLHKALMSSAGVAAVAAVVAAVVAPIFIVAIIVVTMEKLVPAVRLTVELVAAAAIVGLQDVAVVFQEAIVLRHARMRDMAALDGALGQVLLILELVALAGTVAPRHSSYRFKQLPFVPALFAAGALLATPMFKAVQTNAATNTIAAMLTRK